jgi:nucleotide-binding universal stress UspA family protein
MYARLDGFAVDWTEVAMPRTLVPVDGSPESLGAVRHVIRLVKGRESLEIHLLNVQPPVHGDVTMFVSGSAVREFHEAEADRALAPACRLLDDDGVPYTRHIVIGHAAAAIAEWASKLDCHTVVMSTRGHGTMSQLLHGSVINAVIHRMDPGIPVTLVKDGSGMQLQERHR